MTHRDGWLDGDDLPKAALKGRTLRRGSRGVPVLERDIGAEDDSVAEEGGVGALLFDGGDGAVEEAKEVGD